MTKIRIDYDDDILNIVAKFNEALESIGYEFVDDGLEHDGFCVFDLVNGECVCPRSSTDDPDPPDCECCGHARRRHLDGIGYCDVKATNSYCMCGGYRHPYQLTRSSPIEERRAALRYAVEVLRTTPFASVAEWMERHVEWLERHVEGEDP